MKKILFVSSGDSPSGVIAYYFACHLGKNKVQAYHVGALPAADVNIKLKELVDELNFETDLQEMRMKCVIPGMSFDYLIHTGAGAEPTKPFVNAQNIIHWNLPDCRNMRFRDMRNVRKTIEVKVKELVKSV